MSDRVIRYAVRGLVIAVMACAVIATWAARLVLGSGSGTLYGYLIYLPILAAPGWLAWRQPTEARWLGLWGAVGFVSTIAHQTFGRPYSYEYRHEHFDYLHNSTWISIVLVVLVAPVTAFIVAGHTRRHTVVAPGTALLAQRLRRIAQLALALGGVAIALIVMPIEDGWVGLSLAVTVCTLTALAPAAIVLRAPRRSWAFLWSAWTLPFGVLGGLIMTDVANDVPLTWQLSFVAASTASVLLLIVMPLVCVTTRDELEGAAELPAARLR